MYYRITFSIVILTVLFNSCKKEPVIFPDNSALKGCWDQITPYKDRDGLCFDGQDTLYFQSVAGRPVHLDTCIYRLDKKDERLYLRPVTPQGSSESSYKIKLNSEKDELSIWALHSSYSGEEKFKKQ